MWSRPVQVATPKKFEAACSVPRKLSHKGFAPRTRAGQQWGAQVQGGEQCGHGLTSPVQDMRLGNAYAVLDSNTACLSYSDASPGAAQHTVGWLTTLAI